MNKKEKTFRDWTEDDVRIVFGLKKLKDSKLLRDWLKADNKLTVEEIQFIEAKREKADRYIYSWNEIELQTKFIAPLTELVDFDNENYFFSSFSERKINATYGSIPLKGKVDWMVAIGQSQPHLPFFFIHEYKKEQGFEGDPRGQLLSAMLAASILNQTPPNQENIGFNPYPKHEKNMPIYGCYITGQFWRFLVLQKKNYVISRAYDALIPNDLQQIIRILKKQKEMIINRLKQNKRD